MNFQMLEGGGAAEICSPARHKPLLHVPWQRSWSGWPCLLPRLDKTGCAAGFRLHPTPAVGTHIRLHQVEQMARGRKDGRYSLSR